MTHIVSYLQALGFAVLFMVFINGSVGWALIYVLVGVGLASALSVFFSRKGFSVEIRPSAGLVNFGDRISCDIILTKNGFCFLPFIDLHVWGGGAECVRTSLLLRKRAVVKYEFRTEQSGLNTIFIPDTRLRDFWGIISLKADIPSVSAQIAVTPRIVEYIGPEVPPKLLPDDDENAEEGKTVLSGGLPGCEHREYVPGDALRRINYKLSAKRGKLMVRLDETSGTASVNLLISQNAGSECGDMAFALAKSIVMRGGNATIMFRGESFGAGSPETLEKLGEWLAFRNYNNMPQETGCEENDANADVVFSGRCEITTAGG